MAQGCEKKARAFVVFSVLEANDNVFLADDWSDKRR